MKLFCKKKFIKKQLAAQVAHNCCPKYSFLLPGHNPHFFGHWKFASTLGIILIMDLVKNSAWRKMCDVTAVYGGPLELTGQKSTKHASKVFPGDVNINAINMKSWHSKLSLKIGKVSNIFWRWRDFYTPYCSLTVVRVANAFPTLPVTTGIVF